MYTYIYMDMDGHRQEGRQTDICIYHTGIHGHTPKYMYTHAPVFVDVGMHFKTYVYIHT